MRQHDEESEKDNRRERYERRRTRSSRDVQGDTPRKPKIPYKRQQTHYEDWDEEFDDGGFDE